MASSVSRISSIGSLKISDPVDALSMCATRQERLQCITQVFKENAQSFTDARQFALIRSLKDKIPQLEDFFTIYEDRGVLFKSAAIRHVISHLHAKHPALQNSILYCESFNEFRDALKRLKEGKTCLIVRCNYDNNQENHGLSEIYKLHNVPVLIEKTDNSYKIFISDCNSPVEKPFTKAVACVISTSFPNEPIFCSLPQRQADRISCCIFSIRDAIFLLQSPDFMKSCQLLNAGFETIEVDGKFSLLGIRNLPPGMMKMTQSMKTIRNYLDELPTQGEVFVNKKGETLMENIQRHIVFSGEGKEMNGLVFHRMVKYQSLIVNDFFP